MNVKTVEKAIDELGAGVVIEEIKLRHTNVRQVNAHTDNKIIVWDMFGRAFSASKETSRELFLLPEENDKVGQAFGIPLERDKSFDLKISDYGQH